MNSNWQTALKAKISDEFVTNAQEWVDLNISTSGLLNLTIVSSRFIEQPFIDRRKKLSDILHDINAPTQPGFISLYTLQEAQNLQLYASC